MGQYPSEKPADSVEVAPSIWPPKFTEFERNSLDNNFLSLILNEYRLAHKVSTYRKLEDRIIDGFEDMQKRMEQTKSVLISDLLSYGGDMDEEPLRTHTYSLVLTKKGIRREGRIPEKLKRTYRVKTYVKRHMYDVDRGMENLLILGAALSLYYGNMRQPVNAMDFYDNSDYDFSTCSLPFIPKQRSRDENQKQRVQSP
jgi:hypothetical protein